MDDDAYCTCTDCDFLSKPELFVANLFSNKEVFRFLAMLAHIDPFSETFSEIVVTMGNDNSGKEAKKKNDSTPLDLLASLKKLKYFLNLPIMQVLQLMSQIC